MANKGRIDFTLGFKVDQSGLQNLKSQLQALQNLSEKDLVSTNGLKDASARLGEIKQQASAVESALEKSFNPKLNTYNLKVFEEEINKNAGGIKAIAQSWSQAGVQSQIALTTITDKLLVQNKHIKESNKLLDKMAETMANTVRWTIASTALNAMTSSVQKAFSFTQQLDRSLNDIMIVTDKSADDMARFAKSANSAAKELGSVTTDYTKAALIYYQQGLSDKEVAARAETTVKVANITRQSADTVSEQLTAIWNGYKVSAEQSETYIDKVSAVAATTAADLEELATGMSKVASAANIMGVDIDQLNAQIATIVSVTREAPESIGTALKTVYARMSDIQAGLDDEVSYDEYTKQLAEMGINVIDAQGNLRDMGDVIEEIGGKWTTMSRNQQVALAQIIAGTRQYSRMMSLFDNWDMYESAKETSLNSAGAVQQQNEEYLESMEAHMNKLQAQAEELYMALFNAEDINPLIDGLTTAVSLLTDMVDVMGGAKGMLLGLSGLGLSIFGDKMAAGINKIVTNTKGAFSDFTGAKARDRMINDLAEGVGLDTSKQDETTQNAVQRVTDVVSERLKIDRYLSEEQRKQLNSQIEQYTKLEQQTLELERQKKLTEEIAGNLLESGVSHLGTKLQGQSIQSYVEKDLNTDFLNSMLISWNQNDIVNKQQVVTHDDELIEKLKGKINQEKNWENKSKDKEKRDRHRKLREQYEEDLKIQQEIRERHTSNTDFKDVASKIQSQSIWYSKAFGDNLSESDKTKLASIQDTIKALGDASDVTEDDVKALYEALKDIVEISGRLDPELKKVINGADTLDQKMEETAQQAKTTKKSLKQAFSEFDSAVFSSGINGLTAGVTSAIFGVQTLTNSIAALGDESLTTGERTSQFLSGLITSLPMAVNSVVQIKDGFNDVSKSLDGVAKKMGMTGGGLTAGITAALAIIVTGTIIAVNKISEYENRFQNTYETLQKAADDAQQRLNESNQEWNELISSFEHLDGLKDDLADLTDGTVEWRKAIADINNEVTELITKYPELAQYVTRGDDGELVISSAGQAYLKEAQIAEIERNQYSAASLNQQALAANTEARRVDFNEKYKNYYEETAFGAGSKTVVTGVAGSAIGGAIGSAIVGATAGSVVPVIGTVIGALAGVIVGIGTSVAANALDEKADEARLEENRATQNEVLEAYITHGDKIFESEIALAKALNKDVSGLTDLHRAMLKNTAETKALAEAYRAEKATEYQNLVTMGYALGAESEAEAVILSGKAQNLQQSDEYSAEAMKKKYGGGNKADEAAARRFAALAGITVETLTSKGINKVQLNGEEYSMDEIYQRLSTLEAQEAAKGLDTKDFTAMRNRFTAGTFDEMASVIAGDPAHSSFTGLTQSDFQRLQEQGIDAFSDEEWERWAETVGKTVDEVKNNMEDALEATGEAWQELTEEISPEGASLFNSYKDSFNNLGLGQAQTLADIFGQITSRYGVDNGKEFLDAVKETGDSSDEVLDIISNTNWSSIDQVDFYKTFSDALENNDINLTPETVSTLVDGIAKANSGLISSLNREQEKLIYSIKIATWANTKESFSEEEYQKIIELFPRLFDFIVPLQDGTGWRFATRANLSSEVQNIIAQSITSGKTTLTGGALESIGANYIDRDLKTKKAAKEYADAYLEYTNLLDADVTELYKDDSLIISSGNKIRELANSVEYKSVIGRAMGLSTKQINKMSSKDLANYFKEGGWENIDLLQVDSNGTSVASLLGLEEGTSFKQVFQDKLNEAIKQAANNALSLAGEIDNFEVSEEEKGSWINDLKLNFQHVLGLSSSKSEFEALTNFETWFTEWAGEDESRLKFKDILYEYWLSAMPTEEDINASLLENAKVLLHRSLLLEDNQSIYTQVIEAGLDHDIAFENLNAIENLSSAYEAQNEILEDLIDTYELLGREDRLENLTKQSQVIQAQMKNLEDQRDHLAIVYEDLAKNTWQEIPAGTLDFMFGDVANDFMLATKDGKPLNSSTIVEAITNAEKLKADSTTSDSDKLWIDTFISQLQSYQSLATEIADNVDETFRKQLENNLQKFDMKMQVTFEKEEIKRDFNEFQKELADDDDYALQAKIISADIDSFKEDLKAQMGPLKDLLEMDTSKLIEDLDKVSEIQEGQLSKAQYEAKLEEYRKNIQERILSIKEAMEELDQMAIDAQENLNELYEKQIDYLQTAISLLENRIKLSQLIVGKENQDSKQLREVADAQKEIYLIQKERYESLKEEYEKLDKDDHSEYAENIRDMYFNAAKAASDTYLQITEAYRQVFEQELTEIVESAFGISTDRLKALKEDQEWVTKRADHYLDTIDKAYSTDKLRYQYREAMREFDSPSAQRRLNELLEDELALLEDKDTLTEKDFERANKRLELEEARIALEEAQSNKTQMQLTRRADGSYGYEYVADQDAIDDARQKVADLENELINFDEETLKENLNSIYDIYTTFIEDLVSAFTDDGMLDDIELSTLQKQLELIADQVRDNDFLLQNWAKSAGISLEEMAKWSDADFAEYGIQKELYDTLMLLTSGKVEEAFNKIKSGGENAYNAFLDALNIERNADGTIKSSDLTGMQDTETQARNEYGWTKDEYNAQEEGLSKITAAAEKARGAYDELTDAALRLCGALAGANEIAGDSNYNPTKAKTYVNQMVESLKNADKIASAETGGYTGEWGSSGKFILAHEKELILNKTDTANILNAVEIIRSLESSLSNNLMSFDRGYLASSAIWDLIKDWNIEQTVNIDAHFEVADSYDIKEAFNDLVGLATQHVFENTKV